MSKLILEDFVKEVLIIKTSKELLKSETEVKCYDIIKGLTVGQLEKLKMLMLCQVKEISHSLSLISLLVAALAISIPIIEIIPKYGNYLYAIPASIAIGLFFFIIKDGVPLINYTNSNNKKIKYIIYIIDNEIKARV